MGKLSSRSPSGNRFLSLLLNQPGRQGKKGPCPSPGHNDCSRSLFACTRTKILHRCLPRGNCGDGSVVSGWFMPPSGMKPTTPTRTWTKHPLISRFDNNDPSQITLQFANCPNHKKERSFTSRLGFANWQRHNPPISPLTSIQRSFKLPTMLVQVMISAAVRPLGYF